MLNISKIEQKEIWLSLFNKQCDWILDSVTLFLFANYKNRIVLYNIR